MDRKTMLSASIAAFLLLSGPAYAQKPSGDSPKSGNAGTGAEGGDSAGVQGNRASGGSPAEFDTSPANKPAPGQAKGNSPSSGGGADATHH